MKKPRPIHTGYVIARSGKIALLLRLVCLYPVVLSWQNSGEIWELILLLLATAGSLTLLLAWATVVSFVQRHPAVTGADLLIGLVVFASSSTPLAYVGYIGSTAILIGLFFNPLGRGLLVALLAVGFIAVNIFRWTSAGGASALGLTGVSATLVLFVCLAYVGGSMRELQARVNASVQAAREAASEAALGQERSRIAREMHDSLVKTLDGIGLQAKALALTGEAPDAARTIGCSAQQALDESRTLLEDLRSTAVPPLELALERLVDELNARYPARIELLVTGCSQIPGDIRYGAMKIVEEALTNALKHSQADVIRCLARCADGTLRIEVQDDGVGFDKRTSAKRGHMGLGSMRDRAEELGGALLLESRRGDGTRAVLEISVPEHEEAA